MFGDRLTNIESALLVTPLALHILLVGIIFLNNGNSAYEKVILRWIIFLLHLCSGYIWTVSGCMERMPVVLFFVVTLGILGYQMSAQFIDCSI